MACWSRSAFQRRKSSGEGAGGLGRESAVSCTYYNPHPCQSTPPSPVHRGGVANTAAAQGMVGEKLSQRYSESRPTRCDLGMLPESCCRVPCSSSAYGKGSSVSSNEPLTPVAVLIAIPALALCFMLLAVRSVLQVRHDISHFLHKLGILREPFN
jgi:hypothetical protein